MRIDLHLHTEASRDCASPYREVLERCLARRIAVQAVTDHDTIEGALRLRDLAAERGGPAVIVGEEVSTRDGEIIGLFLEARVPPGESAEETVARIKAQNGLVLLPHGFDPLKRYRLQPAARARVAADIDIVEGFNARVSRPRHNRAALAWARERGLAVSSGTDAHRVADVGVAYVESGTEADGAELSAAAVAADPAALLAALHDGELQGAWTHPAVAIVKKAYDRSARAWRRWAGARSAR